MNENSLYFPNLFPILGEILNFKSKEYSNCKKYEFKPVKNKFFSQNGKFTNMCHIFRVVLQINWCQTKFKKTLLVGINTRKSIYSIFLKFNNILEVWISSLKNIFKRVSFILVKGEGDVWQFNFVKKLKNGRILIKIVLLFGTSIWITNVPPAFPQFLIIKKPLFKINLANLFQWKMCLGEGIIITGDISGKITILNVKESIIINQFTHNKEKKIPIGDIKLIEFDNNTPKLLITGGYDGVLRIWSFCRKIFALKEIQFKNRWLVKIGLTVLKENYILILVGFENGFESILSFNNKIKVITSYSNQGSSSLIHFFSKYIISTGNDGFINFIEINSPENKRLDYLRLLNNPYFFVNWGIKPKLNNTILQSIGIKYQYSQINFQVYDLDHFYFSITGITGILIFVRITKNFSNQIIY
mmetsp:Transcript_52237/g.84483  ORF Transcript_52237/g.84483 Transcript_52237/m.84483 type:complete len:415 (-) Transcript_52237:726-1970(-)